jgi:hypothetical protein
MVETCSACNGCWGIDSWETLEFAPPQNAVRVGNTFKLKMAKANLLGLLFHIYALLEDMDTFANGSQVWGKFLKRSRAGIQHICVSVDKWDEVIAKAIGWGGKVYKSGLYDGRHGAHIEGEVGNCVVAIEQRPQPGAPKEETTGVSRVKGKIGNSTELDAIANPSLQHMGVYVKDLHAFMRYMTQVWGIDE